MVSTKTKALFSSEPNWNASKSNQDYEIHSAHPYLTFSKRLVILCLCSCRFPATMAWTVGMADKDDNKKKKKKQKRKGANKEGVYKNITSYEFSTFS